MRNIRLNPESEYDVRKRMPLRNISVTLGEPHLCQPEKEDTSQAKRAQAQHFLATPQKSKSGNSKHILIAVVEGGKTIR